MKAKIVFKKSLFLLSMILLADITALATTYYVLRLEPELVIVDGKIETRTYSEGNLKTRFWLGTLGLEWGLAFNTLRMLAFFGTVLFLLILVLPYAFTVKESKIIELAGCSLFSFVTLLDGVLNIIVAPENAKIPFVLLEAATVILWFMLAHRYWRA